MSERATFRQAERFFDPLMWGWCWLAYRIVLVLPIQWRLFGALLPFAGYYAYHSPRLETSWRWSERVRP